MSTQKHVFILPDANNRTRKKGEGGGEKDSKVLGAYGRVVLNEYGKYMLRFAENSKFGITKCWEPNSRCVRRATLDSFGHPVISRWYAGMRAPRRPRVLGLVSRGTGSPPIVRARVPLLQRLSSGNIGGPDSFRDGQRRHGRPDEPQKKTRAGGRGAGVAATGDLYTGDAALITQMPEALKKIMVVIVNVCTAFGWTISEAKTEIICLWMRECRCRRHI